MALVSLANWASVVAWMVREVAAWMVLVAQTSLAQLAFQDRQLSQAASRLRVLAVQRLPLRWRTLTGVLESVLESELESVLERLMAPRFPKHHLEHIGREAASLASPRPASANRKDCLVTAFVAGGSQHPLARSL